MIPVLVSVDKAGDLKIGRRKCRLYKKDEVVKVAKKYGIKTEKKTVGELCGSIKARARLTEKLEQKVAEIERLRSIVAKKMAAKKAAAKFMKGMVTKNANIAKLRQLNVKTPPKPPKKAMPITKEEAIRRISAMKGLNRDAKYKLVSRVKMGPMSPRRVVKVARELSKLNAAGYRVEV
jgi:dihydroorotate dehydrogenase